MIHTLLKTATAQNINFLGRVVWAWNGKKTLNTKCLGMRAIFAVTLLTGCATVSLPPGQENQTTFTRTVQMDYREVYRVAARQIRTCNRSIGPFGNGYEVSAELDTGDKRAAIEVYLVGLTGVYPSGSGRYMRLVKIAEHNGGTIITTRGNLPEYAYTMDAHIGAWLKGELGCHPKIIQ